MRLAAITRTIGMAVLAGGIGVASLTTPLAVGSAHAATLATVSQQGGESPMDRVARINGLIQSGDCATVRTEVRSLLSENPENLLGSDATISQAREFQKSLDDMLYQASRSC
jgi:hypothetical protein